MIAAMETKVEPRIQKLTIENFRVFRHLELDGIGRCNLLTGENNTGKSSVLEALRILASGASPNVVNAIMELREERMGSVGGLSKPSYWDDIFPWASLFRGFPEFTIHLDPIAIQAGNLLSLDLSTPRLGTESAEEISVEDESGTHPPPALYVRAGGSGQFISMAEGFRDRGESSLRKFPPESRLPSVFIGSAGDIFMSVNGVDKPATQGELWDEAVLENHEGSVVEALQIIEPQISQVILVGGDGRRRTRTAVVRSTLYPRAVPLRSFGDGLSRLFGIMLSLVTARGGLLLIDEFENGLHFSVQETIWKAIFRLANQLDVQVFATSHSYDAVKAFQAAASESAEDGVLIRLTRKGEDIIPTVLAEKDLAIATESGIEVR